jgi:hypothetical protein
MNNRLYLVTLPTDEAINNFIKQKMADDAVAFEDLLVQAGFKLPHRHCSSEYVRKVVEQSEPTPAQKLAACHAAIMHASFGNWRELPDNLRTPVFGGINATSAGGGKVSGGVGGVSGGVGECATAEPTPKDVVFAEPTVPGHYWAKLKTHKDPVILLVTKRFMADYCGRNSPFSNIEAWLSDRLAPGESSANTSELAEAKSLHAALIEEYNAVVQENVALRYRMDKIVGIAADIHPL